MAYGNAHRLTAGNRKKARKLASAADELLHDHLFALFTEPVDRVFVLLGSSVISAKEVYAMEFVHGIDWEDEAEPVQRVSPCAAYPYGPAYTVYRSPNVVQRANAVERKLLQTFVAGCQPVMGMYVGAMLLETRHMHVLTRFVALQHLAAHTNVCPGVLSGWTCA